MLWHTVQCQCISNRVGLRCHCILCHWLCTVQTDLVYWFVPLSGAQICLPTLWKPREKKTTVVFGASCFGASEFCALNTGRCGVDIVTCHLEVWWERKAWLLFLCTSTPRAHHTTSLRSREPPHTHTFPFFSSPLYALCFKFFPTAYLACFLLLSLRPPVVLVCCGPHPETWISGIWDLADCAAWSEEPVFAFSLQRFSRKCGAICRVTARWRLSDPHCEAEMS